MKNLFLLPLVLLLASCAPRAKDGTLSNPLAGFEMREGFIDIHVDKDTNRVFARLPAADEDGVSLRLIHSARLTAGLGSNPVGLDRGWGESGRIISFRQMGDKVIIEAENLRYRANIDNPLEARAVKESFARSFTASLPIIDEAGKGTLVDMTDFLTADSLNLVQHLKDADQGSFKVAKDRTFVDTKNVLAFPDNVEIDVLSHLTPRLGSWSFADNDRELFRKTAYPAFDTVSAAETAADLTFDVLLHPQRAARLVEFHRRDAKNPSLDYVLGQTAKRVMSASKDGRTGEIAYAVQARYAFALMELADSDSGPAVKAAAVGALTNMAARIGSSNNAKNAWLLDRIISFRSRPAPASNPVTVAKALPPGSPIGSE